MSKIKSLTINRLLLIIIFFIASFLRIYKIDKVPVSLFSDELDVGYQAYSIVKTGRDYMGNFMPLHFQSYVEYRAPLYIYSAVPSVAVFGINPWGIRMPAAIFGILGVGMIYLLVKEVVGYTRMKERIYTDYLPLLGAFMLALNPWHIHYSRAAFEVSELVFLILTGMFFFIKSLKQPKFLWLSCLFFGLAPWTYSTAKLFVPIILVCLFVIFFRNLIKFPKRQLLKGFITLLFLGLPLLYVIFFGGGAQRFNYISVFSDPTTSSEVNYQRLLDAQVRIANGGGIISRVMSRVAHNKVNFWVGKIVTNYFESFSTGFLFLRGDISLRHSVVGVGQFYKFEAILLILGIALFFTAKIDGKIKLLISSWILLGAIPSAITNEGGAHATRLILILPPLVILTAFGLLGTINLIKKKFYKILLIISYLFILFISFVFYQHNYWVHFPWYSERWWHAGFKEMIDTIKSVEGNYDKIIITNAEERPYIFFAAYYNYPPNLWQKGFQDENVAGFGELKHIGKFYFGQVDGRVGIKKLPNYLNERILYAAARREIDENLILEPEKTPLGFHLVKAISFPSGEPVFYLLEKVKK